jgi:hypothetical protein
MKPGDKIVLLESIYDHGEDHHPPGWLAHKGEELVVKSVYSTSLGVAHEGNPGAFVVFEGEYQAVTEDAG